MPTSDPVGTALRADPIDGVVEWYRDQTRGLSTLVETMPYCHAAGVALYHGAVQDLAAGNDERAGRAIRQALELDPFACQQEQIIAVFLDRSPDFERGYAVRPWRDVRRPFWYGKHPNGRPLLVWACGSLGDPLMLLRYLPRLVARSGPVALLVEPELGRLALAQPSVRASAVTVQTDVKIEQLVDGWTLMTGLGSSIFFDGDTAGTIPPGPYLTPDPVLVARWRSAIEPAGPGLRVGLAWAAGPTGSRDTGEARTIGLRQLAPLAWIPGIRWFAIQKTTDTWKTAAGGRSAQDEPSPPGLDLVRLGPLFEDLADTAAAMASLDLVITVDSSPCHLAGALGVPVWMLLNRPGDSRWTFGRVGDRTPWYPSMRIFQQTTPGDWVPVVARVADELLRLVASRNIA